MPKNYSTTARASVRFSVHEDSKFLGPETDDFGQSLSYMLSTSDCNPLKTRLPKDNRDGECERLGFSDGLSLAIVRWVVVEVEAPERETISSFQ